MPNGKTVNEFLGEKQTMRNKLGLTILVVLGIALGAMVVRAQSTPPADGVTAGPYTITLDTELGVRFLGTDGNFQKYRSDLNYGRGFRVFNFDFLAHAKDGDGKLFDNFRISGTGWGNDPSAYARIEVDKDKVYRFDANVRQFSYYNNLTNLALNQHQTDTIRKFGDFNLTLLPDNRNFRPYLGYTFDQNSGTGTLTFTYSGDQYPILVPMRSMANDYRAGFDARIWGFDLSFLSGTRQFRDDTTYIIPFFEAGNNPTNVSTLSFLQRNVPTRGHSPYTRFSLHRNIAKKVDFTGHYVYSSALSRFNWAETVRGVNSSGYNVLGDIFSAMNFSKQHNSTGDFGITFFPTDRLTISETFRVNDFQNSGGIQSTEVNYRTTTSAFGTINLPTLITNGLAFRFIGYRQFLNTIEGDYKVSSIFSGHIGYRYNDRRIGVGATDNGLTTPLGTVLETYHTNSWFAGFKLRPFSIWSIYVDYEHGKADNVYVRTEPNNYNNFRVRTSLKPSKTLTLNASMLVKDNDNPSTNSGGQYFGVTSRGRTISTSVDWLPKEKFSLTGGYTFNHFDSNASIIFYASSTLQNGNSLYFVRDHSFFFTSRLQLFSRVNLLVGYRINQDNGQGDTVALFPNQIVSSYPLRFQSPEVRLSFKLIDHVDWNLGYQYYDYKEKMLTTQNYRAHLPYTSLRFTF
jgi:hypothetical protein